MKVVTLPVEARRATRDASGRGLKVGLVPTMGALHAGHLSLVRRCREECGYAVVSIFVNPAQFGPGEDLEAYPRDPEGDRRLLEAEGVDLLLAPEPSAVYAPDHATWVQVEGLTGGLCGDRRPGHFRGVATVVAKLFGMIRPDAAYFGQKDWQQAMVIQRMARDLETGVEVVVCPTVREPDGLAMSSRNAYLSPAQREAAPALHAALEAARTAALAGEVADPRGLEALVLSRLGRTAFEAEYVELRKAGSLEPAEALRGRLVLAAAARLGTTRLIDNVLIDFSERE